MFHSYIPAWDVLGFGPDFGCCWRLSRATSSTRLAAAESDSETNMGKKSQKVIRRRFAFTDGKVFR